MSNELIIILVIIYLLNIYHFNINEMSIMWIRKIYRNKRGIWWNKIAHEI